VLIALRWRFGNTHREPRGDRVASRQGHGHALRYTITSDPCACLSDRDNRGYTWGDARCSVCGTKGNKFYSCAEANCTWDECVDCHNAGRPAQRALERHAHALVRTVGKPASYVQLARCDWCRTSNLPVTHHCAPCQVDYCGACYTRAYGSAPTAPSAAAAPALHPHALVRAVGRLRKHGALAKCDACGVGAEVTHYCAPCDVDICDACHHTNSAPRATAPPASAPAAGRSDEGRDEPLLGDEPVAYAD